MAGNVPHNYDLLAQIAAEDEVTGPVEEPRQISLSMITKFMKMMFHFDSYKKGHPVLFEKLLLSWRAVVIMLLCCGSASLIFMIYMTFSFPTFVRNYLRSTGITVNSVKVEKFSATNVFIKDISGPHNCFKIQMITLNYTLTDLLRGHIKNAKIEGVQINAKITQDYWGMGAIYQFYQKTLDPKIMQIDHLTLADGKIFIDYGGENIIPLTFSMDNTYQSNLIKSEISFKNDANTIVETNGLLTVSGRGEMQWNLDLKQLKTLDRTNIQDISGTVQALSEGLNFKKVQSALTFRKLYSLLDTRLIVNILNNQFTGSFDLAKTDIAEDNKKTTRLYQVQFADLSISKDGKKISTDNPLVLTAKNLSYPHLKIDQIRLSLTGNLSCENSICSYTLNAPAKGNINGLTALFNGHNYISKKTVDFTFDADNKTPFATVSPESIDATFNIKNLAFNGFRNAEISPVTMNMNNIDVVVSTGRKNTAITGNSQLKIAQGFLQTPDYILKDIQANLTDPFSSLPFGKIKIDEVNLLAKDAFLKVPFHLTMDLEKTQGHAKISALDDKIQFKFQGKIDLPTGSFKGSIAMDPVNLETLGKPLDEIYPSFPKGLKDYTGTLTLQGTIDYKNANLIYGPFVLAVENVGATYQNYRFSGLTTYLNVISLMPFATQPDQEIFIADFASPLPAKNIQALFHIDNSYVFMNKLSLKVGQIPLEMDTLVIPMENSNAILYLQNDNVDLQEINDTFVLPYKINMTGFAQVNLPIFLRENGISLQKGQIKLPNVLLSVPKGKRPAFFTDAATFRISNGTIDINSIPDSDKMKIQLQLSDGFAPAKRSLTETIEVDLPQIIKSVPVVDLPQEINLKKQMFIQ